MLLVKSRDKSGIFGISNQRRIGWRIYTFVAVFSLVTSYYTLFPYFAVKTAAADASADSGSGATGDARGGATGDANATSKATDATIKATATHTKDTKESSITT